MPIPSSQGEFAFGPSPLPCPLVLRYHGLSPELPYPLVLTTASLRNCCHTARPRFLLMQDLDKTKQALKELLQEIHVSPAAPMFFVPAPRRGVQY